MVKAACNTESVDMERYVGRAAGSYAAAGASVGAGSVITTGLDGVERLYIAETLEYRGQDTGSRVTLGIPLAPYRAAMNATLRRNLVFLAIAAFVCFLAAWLVERSALPPRFAPDPFDGTSGVGRPPRRTDGSRGGPG